MGIFSGGGSGGSVGSEPVCDFCCAKPITHHLITREFVISFGPLMINTGTDWGTCDVCWKLVQAGQWAAIALRMVEAYQRRYPEMPWEKPGFAREALEFQKRVLVKLRENLIGRAKLGGNGGDEPDTPG